MNLWVRMRGWTWSATFCNSSLACVVIRRVGWLDGVCLEWRGEGGCCLGEAVHTLDSFDFFNTLISPTL